MARVQAARKRWGGSTAERGYDAKHQRERAKWASKVAHGDVPCARCGGPIAPGAAWDLDHSEDRESYLGPAHSSCNRRAGAVKGNRGRRATAAVVVKRSQEW